MYDTVEYARSRLVGTFVKYKEGLVRVDGVGGTDVRIVCGVNDLASGRRKHVLLSSLDLSSPELGYFNIHGGACYITRVPLRRDWRQGLRSNNIYCRGSHHYGSNGGVLLELSCSFNRHLSTFREACERVLEREAESTAFSKEFSVHKRGVVYKERDLIAHTKEGLIRLTPKYHYLENRLQEVLHEEDIRVVKA